MRKHLLAAVSIMFGSLAISDSIHAQPTPLFNIPDTICAGNLVTPEVLDDAPGSSYQWSLCAPAYHMIPTGVNLGDTYPFHAVMPTDIAMAKEDGIVIGFITNSTRSLARWVFHNGIESDPRTISYDDVNGTLPENTSGVEIVSQAGINHVFVVGGSTASNSAIIRYTYGDGLDDGITDTLKMGNLNDSLINPKRLLIARNAGNWYGFTFNNGNELVRLDFGSDVTNRPSVHYLGNVGGVFSDISSINGIQEGDNWHLFITDIGGNKLVKLTFGSSLTNVPFAIDYGTLDGQMNFPIGLAIAPACREYYGFVSNNVGSHINRLFWEESVADTAVAENIGNVAAAVQPTAMSSFVEDNGNMYLFITNSDTSVSRIKFDFCGDASYYTSSDRNPEPFTFHTPGRYTVTLTVDGGTPQARTYCEYIEVIAAPDIIYSPDTMICQGDTAELRTLYAETAPIVWSPDYNLSATNTKVVQAWPENSTVYTSVVDFGENCVIPHEFNVRVSKIAADAGADRTVGDGSSIVLGGSRTTLGDQYTYVWTPLDYLSDANNKPVTSAKPGQSMSYYLEVWNSDGCYAIDSMNVNVTCAEVALPNAFVPGSKYSKTSHFGLMNQRFQKLVYFRVYDRWGKKVFETQNPAHGWDGTFDGKDAPFGVYVWEVDAFCIEGNRIHQAGNVTLVR